MNETIIPASSIIPFPESRKAAVDQALAAEAAAYAASGGKIIVLDDDPTGIQTVHDIPVYTDWSPETIQRIFASDDLVSFILTNSRGLTEAQTTTVHQAIATAISSAATSPDRVVSDTKKAPYMIISRSDSTLRGHYPLETETLRDTLSDTVFDGEILCFYFKEGGRFTLNNTHYVQYGDQLIPAAQTEFAKDKTFGYTHSNLPEYVQEKTKGHYTAAGCLTPNLRVDSDEIANLLCDSKDFQKIIVSACDDYDVKNFAVALYKSMKQGKHFLIRSAAALVKALGNISDRPLLTREELVPEENRGNGGLIIVGSHTAKTTSQIEALRDPAAAPLDVEFIELNSDLVVTPELLAEEVDRVLALEEKLLKEGKTVLIHTCRKLLTLPDDTPEKALLRSVAISDALTQCVSRLTVTPAYIVAKGGITSSDVGVKALKVKKAIAAGQIQPGIPVWKTDETSRFPGVAYVIFPGNVGTDGTLRAIVEKLSQ